jgi:hypothetical protein
LVLFRHLTTFRSRLGLRSIWSQRTCSENPAVDRCPATAGFDVERTSEIATVDLAVRGFRTWEAQ